MAAGIAGPSSGRRAKSRLRLLATLGFLATALLVVELQRTADYATLAFIDDRDAFATPFAHAVFKMQIVVLCAAPLLAGVLVDLHGVRRTVGLTIVGWCALVSLGVSVLAPLPYRLGAPLADELVPGFILCASLATLARLLDPRRRGVAAMIVILLFFMARARPHLATAMLRAVASDWQEAMFLLVAIGAFAAAVWLAGFREPPVAASATPSLRDAVVAVGTVAWANVILAALDPPRLEPLLLARGAVAENLPAMLGIAVALAASHATDRLSRRLGRPPSSRIAALLPGFLLAAFAGLVDVAARQPPPAMGLVLAAAAGLTQVSHLLAVDRAPRRSPGLFIGLVLAADLAALQYLGPLARSLVPHDALLVAAGLAGAAWSGLLLRPPPKSARHRRSGDVAGEAAPGEEHEERDQGRGGADEGQAGVA